jgi:hypothetical protein
MEWEFNGTAAEPKIKADIKRVLLESAYKDYPFKPISA